MSQLKRRDYIEFLVKRAYPPILLVDLDDELPPSGMTPADRAGAHKARSQYKASLQLLPLEELKRLSRAANGGSDLEPPILTATDKADETLNDLEAWADFNEWMQREFWSFEEAAALSVGRDPRIVNWKTIGRFVAASPIAKEFARVCEMLHRAHSAAKLQNPITPIDFVAWAKKRKIFLPAKLLRHPAILASSIDWRQKASELATAFNNEYSALEKELEKAQRAHQEAVAELAKLRAEMVELQSQISASKRRAGVSNPSFTRERENLLKIIFVMSKERPFGFKPGRRNDATVKILNLLLQEGFDTSDDTIRRALNTAWEIAENAKIELKQ